MLHIKVIILLCVILKQVTIDHNNVLKKENNILGVLRTFWKLSPPKLYV